jgi:hypothetical protein
VTRGSGHVDQDLPLRALAAAASATAAAAANAQEYESGKKNEKPTQINGSGGQPERPGEAKQSHYETTGRPQASFRAVPVAGVPLACSAYLEFHIRVAQALGGPYPWLAEAGIVPC